ncbi:MAG: universal stress protein [Myxococcota bacterium]
MKLERVLVPVDLSEPSRRALAEAAALIAGRKSRLTVLHAHPIQQLTVLDFRYVEPPEKVLGYRDAAQRTLEQWVKELGLTDVELVVEMSDPVATIIEASKHHDLVVMGTHGRTGLEHFVLGSVAERVVRAAKCSVLIVRPSS